VAPGDQLQRDENLRSNWDSLNQQIIACDRCARLRDHCKKIAIDRRAAFRDWTYWGKPVPNFGDPHARLLIVGLAPAAHGANRTGRMFTGDRSGDWLYRAMHKAGFANQASAEHAADGLTLTDCAITATCHCAPPDNKPTPCEITECASWLQQTCDVVSPRVFLALGGIAWTTVVREATKRGWLERPSPKFGHGAVASMSEGRWLLGSYHPSQQNTFTGKLTEPMLDQVFMTARRLLSSDQTP
jgi:uracil-DNA glycosylase family 4